MIEKESPLQGINTGSVDTVSIRELRGLHTIDLRVAPGTSTLVAVAESLGLDLPWKPGQARGTTAHVLCLAPDWWLIVGQSNALEKLAALRLKDDYHFSAVDVSGQRTTIELEGAHVREVLAHLWEQDLREKSFPVGAVSQGLMAKAPVIVWHVAPDRYRIMVRSSFALHLWKAVEDAAAEYL